MINEQSVREGQLVQVSRVDSLLWLRQQYFNGVVDALLKDAPNVLEGRILPTRWDNQMPTQKAVNFQFRNSMIMASYMADHGWAPTRTLEIRTPIIIDNLESDFSVSHHPLNPHEIVEVESNYYGRVEVTAKAVNRLGDFGYEVTLEQYTAGGLLPPISTLGRGKLDTLRNVTDLFRWFTPQNPIYSQPY